MASGLPIACSNYGPMREILQDGGEYFDPENYENIKEILKKLIISSELRMTLSNKAYKLSKKFKALKKCSQQTLSFLHEIAFDFEKINKMFDRKKILITGGTGSFGKATVKSILKSSISEIRIFSRDEKNRTK